MFGLYDDYLGVRVLTTLLV